VAEGSTRRGGVVLVVEDDGDLREALAETIEAVGWYVLTAKGGADALAQLDAALRPCLVFLDLGMWPMGGQEFLERLQKRPDAADFPVVLTSGSRPLPSTLRNLPGVVALLPKPFGAAQVLVLLNEFG
jgi:two-component system response regulator FlrC